MADLTNALAKRFLDSTVYACTKEDAAVADVAGAVVGAAVIAAAVMGVAVGAAVGAAVIGAAVGVAVGTAVDITAGGSIKSTQVAFTTSFLF